ncbi:hypothetical protein [Okeania sp.]|uniref:hypothetical protein n=1 Tax=Okeania sp. TaxID=3100323 RepID=UPI002B4AD013|nr:hypothetical protein [Okeania sp.]MEB3339212.1 hypothetical protein [Okeania sp.]
MVEQRIIGTTEAAYLSCISPKRLRDLLCEGRVKNAWKENGFWHIPVYGAKGEEMPIIFPGTRGPKGNWCKEKRTKPTMIHVNQHKIKENAKNPEEELKPVISVKQTNHNYYGFQLEIKGPCRIVYSPHNPAKCGAHLWIDTFSRVQFIDVNFNPITACRAYKYI